ncbi:MAG TPA: TIGR04282 family arsenosugar biosynthesis glycosyltransferase [Chitinophagales bacterium]|nr:TIGR04282 family arsenosugar biosynthesis glycosyltransferase [Chitinophagales bacterium]HRK26876.1 TIGR04282 family arsenosugar biosynthesis glycosyltransferase [Chitinophagales bacterium]
METTLLVFVKNPIPGEVKTRIAATAGTQAALQIYQALLHHTHQITLPLPYRKQVFYSRFIPTADEWTNGYEKYLQTGNYLGERMSHAFEQAFESAANKALIIGSDCLQLTTLHIENAVKMLSNGADVVIGPAADGGYYLLGMNWFYPTLLQGIAWSTEKVLQQTLHRAAELALTVQLLPALSDVDTYEDWIRCGGVPIA